MLQVISEKDNSLIAILSGYSHVSANTIESLRAGAMSLAVGTGEWFSCCVLLPSCTKKWNSEPWKRRSLWWSAHGYSTYAQWVGECYPLVSDTKYLMVIQNDSYHLEKMMRDNTGLLIQRVSQPLWSLRPSQNNIIRFSPSWRRNWKGDGWELLLEKQNEEKSSSFPITEHQNPQSVEQTVLEGTHLASSAVGGREERATWFKEPPNQEAFIRFQKSALGVDDNRLMWWPESFTTRTCSTNTSVLLDFSQGLSEMPPLLGAGDLLFLMQGTPSLVITG